MNPITEKPRDRQKCLINHGGAVEPAIYDESRGQFMRYPNEAAGDRCALYYYSNVSAWQPFPELPKETTFIAEPEPPLPAPRFPNGEPKGDDGWPTAESFSSIGL